MQLKLAESPRLTSRCVGDILWCDGTIQYNWKWNEEQIHTDPIVMLKTVILLPLVE